MATSSSFSRTLPLRLPRLCIALAGDEGGDMLQKAEAAIRDNPFFEFRLDYLRNPAAAFPKIKRFIELHPDVVIIATYRRAAAGGRFKGSVAAQLGVLHKAAAAGCQLLDVELESAEAVKPAELEKLRARAGLLISFHDFKATRKLNDIFQRMQQFRADYYKLVTTATSLHDNVEMMKFLQEKSYSHSVVGLCMGEQGIISRLLGLRAGSVFTFASVSPGEETAPGQVAARALRDVYRINQVDAATRVYGVAGDPVSESLSPVMMNAAFRLENVNAVFLPLHAKSLEDLLACVRDIPIHGLAVTMPYKQQILPQLDNTDAVTAKVQACNTVIRAQDGRLYGYNTDVLGLLTSIESHLRIAGAKVLVLGAGGVARAAVFGLTERGAEVYIVNRTPASGQKLAKEAKAKYLKRAELKKFTFDLIINATPVGMAGSKLSPLSPAEIRTRYLLEMIYTTPETPLTRMARAQGVTVISGSEMFVFQGARQFEIWTGKPAPVAEMQFVVTTALEARAAAALHAAAAKKNGKSK